MYDTLAEELTARLLDGDTLLDYDGNKHNLNTVMDYVYANIALCDAENAYAQRLTDSHANAVEQCSVLLERNAWVKDVVAGYVDFWYKELEAQNDLDAKEDQARYAAGL